MDYAEKVNELLKLSQEYCKMCGLCCKIATFKGGMSYEEVKKIANDFSEPTQADGAKDFLTIFEPMALKEAIEVAPGFVKTVQDRFPGKKDKVCFFKCRFIKDGCLCMIHEDRPLLCRMYPIPHERTVYHNECGFKEVGERNWEEIKQIIITLQNKTLQLEEEKKAIKDETENLMQESNKILEETLNKNDEINKKK